MAGMYVGAHASSGEHHHKPKKDNFVSCNGALYIHIYESGGWGGYVPLYLLGFYSHKIWYIHLKI